MILSCKLQLAQRIKIETENYCTCLANHAPKYHMFWWDKAKISKQSSESRQRCSPITPICIMLWSKGDARSQRVGTKPFRSQCVGTRQKAFPNFLTISRRFFDRGPGQ
jgi:hypothetical protein